MNTTVEQCVRNVVAELLGVPASELRLDHNLKADLNADSLDIVEVVMGLEDEFEIEIPDEEVDSSDITISELIAVVNSRLKQPKS